MLLVTPIACLLLAWGDAPATPEAPHDVRPAPLYEVMQIKSGVEMVVRHDRGGKLVTVRLLGIDTPEIAPDPRVDRLNQMKFLHGLVQINDLVSLETEPGTKPEAQGHLLAHVRRATDNLWLNMDMIEQGFATTSNTEVFAAQAEFAAAEERARTDLHGMWAPDFLANAAQPATFPRVHPKPRPVHPAGFGQVPPGGMFGGNNGMMFVPNRGGGSGSDSKNDRDEDDRKERQRQRDNESARPGSNTYTYPYYPNPTRPLPNWVPYNDFGGGFVNPGGNSGIPGGGYFGGYAHPEHSSGSGGGNGSGSSGSSGESHSGGSSEGHHGHHGK